MLGSNTTGFLAHLIQLQVTVSRLLETFGVDDDYSAPQALWDTIKREIKLVIQQHGVQRAAWRHSTLKMLKRKRNRFLRGQPVVALRSMVLPPLDTAIYYLQQELVDIMALRAGVRWREHSERSPTYLKKIHATRSHKQFMATLRTGPDHEILTTDQSTMRSCAKDFYQHLSTINPVDEFDIDRYLSRINIPHPLSTEDAPITISELQHQVSRVSSLSSPGDDGLGYPIVSLLFGLFPRSWKSLRVRLLPKNNDLALLKNWRPISLINCDAKVYTRLLTRRLAPKVSGLFNKYQTGFLPGRFIAANGLALKIILEQANAWRMDGVGLLLDQEKAYDRVHPVYLQKVLAAFGIPQILITSIINLFFRNRVAISINGFFTDDVDQQRRLPQDNPLSPLLFNLALEPLLLSILQDPHITGFVSPTTVEL
ncbi:hypothetical protein [Absidia glauca]|uniref:Reverse transcriptase domain-containing protein n=1 Tax=Absidia glauca TaxID=4829 RepID=A0A163MV30_ABSGL|nr:hypothetical protein [Absidia glauca]